MKILIKRSHNNILYVFHNIMKSFIYDLENGEIRDFLPDVAQAVFLDNKIKIYSVLNVLMYVSDGEDIKMNNFSQKE